MHRYAQYLDKPMLLLAIWASICICVLFTASVPTDLAAQQWLAACVLLCLFAMRNRPLPDVARHLFLLLGAYLTARYFFWRTFNTLTYHDFVSFVGTILLYLAEVFGMTLYLLSIFVSANPLKRAAVSLSTDLASLPSVDILIPTYNESMEILEVTLLAAMQVRYPKDKLRVYLLDDGATAEKRTNPIAEVAAAAGQRYDALRALCDRVGTAYITRDKNEYAKAGNLNAALKLTHGELILVLDADHVPTVDILEKTVGLFARDPKLFLVQTPHFFVNPDPIEKQNRRIFGEMPGESEMFYSVIQHGLDFWNASFFCGSAAVLRRRHLDPAGGISCSTITEDAETSLDMHGRGYRSAYVDHPMISGLQPETYTDFMVQRLRWAQGMVQIFVLKNPFLVKGLHVWQRLAYLSSSFFWFFGYARVVFLLAPAAFLIFGLRVYDANLREFVAYAIPHLVASMLVADYLFGKVRWAFVSELYEIMQSLFSLPAICKVLINPHAPTFNVTPKGEPISADFISKMSGPFYVIYIITLGALAAGVYRYFNYPLQHDTIYITMAWALLNLILLNAAIGALFERRQRRLNPRLAADIPAQLLVDGSPPINCRINDLSHNGASLTAEKSAFASIGQSSKAQIHVYNAALGKFSTLPVSICNSREVAEERVTIGTEFLHISQSDKAEAVALAHGDSARWVQLLQRRKKRQGILRSFMVMMALGTQSAGAHFYAVFSINLRVLGRTLQNILGRNTSLTETLVAGASAGQAGPTEQRQDTSPNEIVSLVELSNAIVLPARVASDFDVLENAKAA